MPFRYHRSYKIPGLPVRLNVNKRSMSLTFGTGPVHETVSTTGRRTLSVHIGEGLSWRKTTRRRRG